MIEEFYQEKLDYYDPLLDPIKMSLNDIQTLNEFINFYPCMYWGEDTGVTIDYKFIDTYKEIKGDTYIYQKLAEFNEMRREWAFEQIDKSCEKGDFERQKAAETYLKYVTKSASSNQMASFVKLFKKMRNLSNDEINIDDEYIGTRTGIYDLDKNCHIGENQYICEYYTIQEDFEFDGLERFVTKGTRGGAYADFDDDARAIKYDDRWNQFVLEIMGGDEEKAAFLQRACGYSIYGGNREDLIFIAHGLTTRNGKSTLLNSIVYALGDYASTASSDFLLRKRNSSQGDKDELASLANVRFLVMSEPQKGSKLDESKVKQLTGNDNISTSRKFGHTFTYKPKFTMWLNCNNLPEVEDTTVFNSGRVVVIPFDVHFDKAHQDLSLRDRFESEKGADTVLKWLFDGYAEYKRIGLCEPESVKQATAQWVSVDDFANFIDDCCILKTTSKVDVNEFTEVYQAWCEDKEISPLSRTKLALKLRTLSIDKRKSHNKRYFVGIELKDGAKKLPQKGSKGAIKLS